MIIKVHSPDLYMLAIICEHTLNALLIMSILTSIDTNRLNLLTFLL